MASDSESSDVTYFYPLLDYHKDMCYDVEYYHDEYAGMDKRSIERDFGDGGYLNIEFNIFLCDMLPVSKPIHNLLKKEFRSLARQNNDFRQNEPIQNVIDPELYCFRLDRNIFVDRANNLFQEDYLDPKDSKFHNF